ncbi:hypothetical protein AB0C51_23650 [Streptomyces pathocidini]
MEPTERNAQGPLAGAPEPGEAPITQNERTVLRAIDAFLDTKPPYFPLPADLARVTGLSEHDATEAVRALERLDYIVVEPPKLGGTGEITRITRTGQHHL